MRKRKMMIGKKDMKKISINQEIVKLQIILTLLIRNFQNMFKTQLLTNLNSLTESLLIQINIKILILIVIIKTNSQSKLPNNIITQVEWQQANSMMLIMITNLSNHLINIPRD